MQSQLLEVCFPKAPDDSGTSKAAWIVRWFPFGITTVQVIPCFVLLTLSSYRIVIGGVALFSATLAGPFEVFHQNAIRIPLFVIAGGMSLLNLYMYIYAKRRREMPASRWRLRPQSLRERRIQNIQLYSSLLTLAMIAGDFVAHWLHA